MIVCGKIPYQTADVARKVREQWRVRGGMKGHPKVYHCKMCDAFHLGRERTLQPLKRALAR